jgi:hypothetical protein
MTKYRDAKTAPKRSIALAACLVIVVASCGGGELTLTEYAEEVEGLTTTMYRTLNDLTAELAAKVQPPEVPTAEDIQTLYAAVAAAYRDLLGGLEAIDPPKEVAELHTDSLDIMTRLAAAQEAFARRATEVETENELSLLWETPEFLAAESAQEEIVAFCQAAQARFDATADREVFADAPWIPPEMQEVVLVAFGCETEVGGGS